MTAPPPERAARLARLRGIYAIVGDEDPVERAEAALAGGVGVVQVRMKTSPAGWILDAARRIVERARGRALVIVTDRADLAVLAGADGVHVGDDDLPTAEARRLVGPDLLEGRSTRTLEDARAALAAGADHVGFGPIFATRTKAIAVPPRGLEALAATAAGLGAPVVAIGGIGEGTIGAVAAAGAACAAVVDAVYGAGDPEENARRLAAAFAAGRGGAAA